MRKHVLIVDDDPTILETVSLLLSYYGFEVIKAPSGTVCLDTLRQGFQGVILMDIMMPGLNGWETIRALAEEQLLGQNLICMLTAKAEPGAEGEDVQEHVFDYLPKPFDGNNLLEFVQHASSYLAA